MDDKHNSRLLASYALFKGLFDNGKDSYGVIAEYLKKIISEEGLYAFTLDDITCNPPFFRTAVFANFQI